MQISKVYQIVDCGEYNQEWLSDSFVVLFHYKASCDAERGIYGPVRGMSSGSTCPGSNPTYACLFLAMKP